MKKVFKILVLSLLLVSFVFAVAACDGKTSGNSDESGIVCKKFGEDTFYTVTHYYGEDNVSTLDIVAAANKKYAKNGEKIVVGAIKKNAFKGNDTLKEIVLSQAEGEELEIQEGAFAGMKKLEKITLPFVGANADSDATIKETAPAENKATDKMRIFGYIFGEEEVEGSSAISLTYGKESATFYIPATLYEIVINSQTAAGVNIPMYAFCGLKQITSVKLEGNIRAIGDSAFKGMTKLAKINIPASVKVIYNSAFEGADGLKTFGTDFVFDGTSSLTEIKDGAFSGTKLTSFTLPASVTKIGENCFAGSSLVSFTFNANIASVGAYAFYDSAKLATVNNMPSADKIGVNAFDGTLLNA